MSAEVIAVGMRIETHPFNYQIEKNFPFRQRLASFEGGDVWLAENDDFYYIIVDKGTMADLLIQVKMMIYSMN